MAFRWASGHRLEPVLTESELAAGDFVRWRKRLIDLLGQVATAAATSGGADDDAVAAAAIGALRRSVVTVTAEE